jgi:hypothetical protein
MNPLFWAIPFLAAGSMLSQATVVTLDYSRTFESGGDVYPGTGPFLRATLSDHGPTSKSVHFQLEALNLKSGDYVRTWAFNFDGAANHLIVGSPTKTGAFDTPTLKTPSSNLGGGNPPFSFSLDFATSNKDAGAHRLSRGEALGFDITLAGSGILTVEDFLGTLRHMNQDLVSGVFFAGTSGSFHYKGEAAPVPEPATFAFAGVLLAGIIAAETRRARKRATHRP